MKHTQRWITALLIGFGCLLLASVPARAALGDLRLSFINVGQGDAILVQAPGNFDALIDGGKPAAGPTVVAYLRAAAIDDLDVLAASHADLDHIGGLIDVLEATDIPVEALVYNGYAGGSLAWQSFLQAGAARGLTPTPLAAGQTLDWGGVAVHVLNPISGLADPETNAASLVLHLQHGQIDALLTGDLPAEQEDDLLAWGLAPVEILKVAHHGSAGSTSADFLSAAQPQVAVISVGANSYGHPAPETLARLQAAGAQVWRTDQTGSIVIVSDGLTYQVAGAAPLAYALYLPVVAAPVVAPPPAPEARVEISDIAYRGVAERQADEYVEIYNAGAAAVDLAGWVLSDAADHRYTFPAFAFQPGQTCRVYTNQTHPDFCGFTYASSVAIWNDSGDCAALFTPQGATAAERCY